MVNLWLCLGAALYVPGIILGIRSVMRAKRLGTGYPNRIKLTVHGCVVLGGLLLADALDGSRLVHFCLVGGGLLFAMLILALMDQSVRAKTKATDSTPVR